MTLSACDAITPPPNTRQWRAGGEPGSQPGHVPHVHAREDDPVDAAELCAAIHWRAGSLSSNLRWVLLLPLTKQERLRRARMYSARRA
jgi:hypothetical protein